MAGYQISFNPCADLERDAAPGQQVRLEAPLGLRIDEADDGSTRVAEASRFGAGGEAVTLGSALVMRGEGGLTLRLDMLLVDERTVGVVGANAGFGGGAFEVVSVSPARGRLAAHAEEATPARTGKSLFCLTPGTLIDTPDGARPIEALRTGDRVTTLDNGSQPLRWVGRREVGAGALALREDLRPVVIDPGVLGNDRPLIVAPRHRILLGDWRAQVYFGEDQVLIPVQALLNGTTIRQMQPEGGMVYLHLLFDRHEVIVTEGALSESFHPGEAGLSTLDARERQEIDTLFPGASLGRRRAAFPIVRMAEARALRLPG